MTESFFLDDTGVEAVAVYAGKNTKHISEILLQNNITVAVGTKQFREKFGEFKADGVEMADGVALYRSLIPNIIKKAVKMACVDTNLHPLAVSEENPDFALSIIKSLCNDFRYITIISNNKKKASEISEKILDEFGLPVVVADSGSKIKCNVAVKTGAQIPLVPKNSIVIDACAEHTITRKNMINWVEVSPRYNLPYDIDSLSLVQVVQRITGKELNCKISGFRCGKSKTAFEG